MTQGAGPGEPSEDSKRIRLAREASQIFEAPRPTPLQILARGTLVALLLLLIFGVLVPQFADYSEVWDAITSLSAAGLALMIALTLTIELMKLAAPSLLIDGLGLGRAFLAQESAAVVSNTIPGPSGTIAKYTTYRRYGIEFVDFSRGTVVNGVWSNLVPLILPSIAMLLLTTEEEVPDRVLVLTLVALGLSVAAMVVGALVVRSERFARGSAS